MWGGEKFTNDLQVEGENVGGAFPSHGSIK